MDWKKAIGFGAVIWILMFVVVSIFIAFKVYDFTLVKLIGVIIVGVIVYILAGYVKPVSPSQALGYGLCWVIVGLILDFLVTYRFNNQFFYMRSLWLGYFLTLVVPLAQIKKAQ